MSETTPHFIAHAATLPRHGTFAKIGAFFSEKAYKGEDWTLSLSKNAFPTTLARGEKSTAVWGFNIIDDTAFRIHLFKYPRIVLSTEGRLKDELTEYFAVEGRVDHYLENERPTDIASSDNTTGKLIEFRLTESGQTKVGTGQILVKSYVVGADFHVEDGIKTRDIVAMTFAEKDRRQGFVLALTYPTDAEQPLKERLQSIFFDAARTFKIIPKTDTDWNGAYFTPTKPA